ncbi:MAG: hypothetical protein ABR499_08800 [Gemmatimonadaceae bacterium]
MLRRSFVTAAAAIALLAACGGDSSTAPDANIAGSYTLETVNGNGLPWRFFVLDDDWIEVATGTGSINADGTYSLRLDYRFREAGEESTFNESSVGTYTRNGNAIEFTDADGSRLRGSISGRRITVTSPGVVLVFERD